MPARPPVAQPVLPQATKPAAIQPQAGNAFALPANFTLKPRGSGQALPEPIQKKMEAFFNTSFADVRVHVGHEAPLIGALAFTHGTDLYFAPGQFNPQSTQGQQLIGHELTHVVQQRAGRVRNPLGGGVAVVQDPALEAEAERMGLRAATTSVPIQTKTAAATSPFATSAAAVSGSSTMAANGAILPATSPSARSVQKKQGPVLPAKISLPGTNDPNTSSQLPAVKTPHSGGKTVRSDVLMRYKHLVENTLFPETRYSNDELMYVRGPHELYATAEVVDAANRKLIAVKSLIRLRHSAGETSPNFLKTLGRVHLTIDRATAREFERNVASSIKGIPEEQIDALATTVAECHVTSQMVMGSVDSRGGTSLEVAVLPGRTVGPVEKEQREDGQHIANRLAVAVIRDWNDYRSGGQRSFPGINEQVHIEVGLALTQVNHPGEKTIAKEAGIDKWNFHWAGIILESETDYVVLENFALDSLALEWNDKWRFRMHSKLNASQSFHAETDQGLATATRVTISVKAVPALGAKASQAPKKCTICGAEFPTIQDLFAHKKSH